MRKAIFLAVLLLTAIAMPVIAETTHVSPSVTLVSVNGSEITVKLEVATFDGFKNVKVVPTIVEGPNENVKCYTTTPDGAQIPVVSVTKTLDNLLVFDAGIIIEGGKYALSCDANLVKLKWSTGTPYDYESYSLTAYNYAFTLKNIELQPTEVGIDPSLESSYIQDGQYLDVMLSLKQSDTAGWVNAPVKAILNANGISLIGPDGSPVEVEEVSVGEAFGTASLRLKIKGSIISGDYQLKVAKNSLSITDKSIGNPAFNMTVKLQATTAEDPESTYLRVSSPDSHAYEITCPEGYSATVTFHPAEGWSIESVLYNDTDVTGECEGNTYVTPPMKGANHLQLITKADGPTQIENLVAVVPVLGVVNHALTITGIPSDVVIEVYDVKGVSVYRGCARSIPLSAGKTYLVNISGAVYKFMVP